MMQHSFLHFVCMLVLLCCHAVFVQDACAQNYKSPTDIIARKDGKTIFVALQDAQEILVRHALAEDNILVQTFSLPAQPRALALSPDGKTLFVAAGDHNGVLLAVDCETGKVLKTVKAGHTPRAVAVTPYGNSVFVCNQFSNDTYQYAWPDLNLLRKINMVREPRGIVVTPDGQKAFVTNGMPHDVNNIPENPEAMIDVASEVTVIDIASGETKNIRLPNGSGALHGICISPDGRYVYMTEVLARYQMPTNQVARGWMNTAGLSIIDTTKLDDPRGGFVNTVLLDDVDRGAANPYGITTSPDGKQIFVAIAGTSELIVVDAEAMHKKLATIPLDEEGTVAEYAGGSTSSAKSSDVPNDLAFLSGMKQRIPLEGKGARSVVVVKNITGGNTAYVGMYFSDTLQCVYFAAREGTKVAPVVSEDALGPKPEWTAERRGEIYWNDATLCVETWQSCATCHPDARMDAYNWDLLNDGMGNPKNAKSLLWCSKTPPTMWEGVRASSAVCTRTGFQYILFMEAEESVYEDIGLYLKSLNPLPSPYLVDGNLSESAERGKKIFEDPKVGCAVCHPAPLFTDMKLHDVSTKCYFDRKSSFDTPTLVETWRTAPYLHDGRYLHMKDVFKLGKHGDVMGDIEGLSDEQLDDLVEYILSL